MDIKLSELPNIAAKILSKLVPGDILALSGPLASGKTTLTAQILKTMGYTGRVTSPTFVLEKHYPVKYYGFRAVTHLDFYRLKPTELTTFGWQEYLGDENSLTIIEWPEIGQEHLPKETKLITIEIIDDQTRHLTFSDNFGF